MWSCDILSKICAASLAEDKYGILQVRREREREREREKAITCTHTHMIHLCSLVYNGEFHAREFYARVFLLVLLFMDVRLTFCFSCFCLTVCI